MFVVATVGKWLARGLLISIPAYLKAKRLLSKEIDKSERDYQEERHDIGQFAPNLDSDTIRRHQEAETKRLKSIDDKARANLLGIAIGVAVLFSGLDLVAAESLASSETGWVRIPILILYAAAVCYLFTGGLMALKALRLRQVYSPSLRDEAVLSRDKRDMQAIWAIGQNERTAMMRTNALSVSFDGIRNGIVSIAVAVVCFAVATAFTGLDSQTHRPVDGLTPDTIRIDPVHRATCASIRTEESQDLRGCPPTLLDDSTDSPVTLDMLP